MVQCLRSAGARRLVQLLCAWALALAAAAALADAPNPVPAPPACTASAPRQPGRPVAVPVPKAAPLLLQNFVYCSPAPPSAPVPVAVASAAVAPASAPATAPTAACPLPAPATPCTVDPTTVPTSVEINLGKGIGLKFQSAGWLAWVLTGLCALAVIAVLFHVLRSRPVVAAGGSTAPASGWPWLAALLALVLGLFAGLALAPEPQLSDAQLRALQDSPQFKAAMVELVEAKAEAARLRERVVALELAARAAVPAPPLTPAPQVLRMGGYDLFSLVLGAALAVAVGIAACMRWVQEHAQMRELLRAIGAAVSAAGPWRTTVTKPEAGPPSADAIALVTVRRLLSGRWGAPGDSP
ncbi:hypothetical protein DES41_108316 [Pseudorhodoferax soli]|uniref:Uncharacterized protein n=1 Tax=Pseudorhodoferax soli TaxID=545864 RepID=A0A368XQ41_9BURK|nr:hypothetical protein DES41_108316 [Pseudorhodoferax soli]